MICQSSVQLLHLPPLGPPLGVRMALMASSNTAFSPSRVLAEHSICKYVDVQAVEKRTIEPLLYSWCQSVNQL